jgi:hypothetical protein
MKAIAVLPTTAKEDIKSKQLAALEGFFDEMTKSN